VSEAKKLLPYIKACDVYSGETAGLTEESARITEENWKDIHRWNLTKTAFYREIVPRFGQDRNPEMGAFTRKHAEYLFLEKKPVWCSERLTAQEMQEERENWQKGMHMGAAAKKLLVEDKLQEFLEAYHAQHQLLADAIKIRDKNIAKNLQTAEQYLRAEHPSLSAREPLRLTLHLGREHFPEEHMTGPKPKIIALAPSYTSPQDQRTHELDLRIFKACYNGTYDLEVKQDLLELAQALLPPGRDHLAGRLREFRSSLQSNSA